VTPDAGFPKALGSARLEHAPLSAAHRTPHRTPALTRSMVVLTLKAKNDHLQKVASTRDYVKALGEFVWNALDGDATRVSVELVENPLGGLESIIIRDSGIGISKVRAEHDFESLGESWKRQTHRTPLLGCAIHGKEGQGRLKFFSLAQRAHWASVYKDGDELRSLTIEIDADSLQTSNVSDVVPPPAGTETGTMVLLAPLKNTFDWLKSEEARSEFNAIFALYVLQYPGTEIVYNGRAVDPAAIIEREHPFKTQAIICPTRTERDLTLRVIEWKAKVKSRKIYFGGEAGVVLGSQAANISAPDFDFSVYAYSPYFQEISNANLLEFDGLTDPNFAKILGSGLTTATI
jgi:Histidine kinase-, DNA gyrase B-, and HSP90-like ATPase